MDTDIYEANERYRRTFQMTDSKRRLAEYPLTPDESYEAPHYDRVMAFGIALWMEKELHKYVPKPERTDRLLEYKQVPADRYHEWNESTFINGEFIQASLGRRYEDPNSPFTDHKMIILDFSNDEESKRNDWMNYKDYLTQKRWLDEAEDRYMRKMLGWNPLNGL